MRSHALLAVALVAICGVLAKTNLDSYINNLNETRKSYVEVFFEMARRMEVDTDNGMAYSEAFYKELSVSVKHWYEPKYWQFGAGSAFKRAIDRPCTIVRRANELAGPWDESAQALNVRRALRVCDLYKDLGPSSVKQTLTKDLSADFKQQRANKVYFKKLLRS